jgi:hypothetical protein
MLEVKAGLERLPGAARLVDADDICNMTLVIGRAGGT